MLAAFVADGWLRVVEVLTREARNDARCASAGTRSENERGCLRARHLRLRLAAWQRVAERYMREPSILARARLPTLRKLLTLHARKDRFCEGHFAAVLESGHFLAILKRVETLLARP